MAKYGANFLIAQTGSDRMRCCDGEPALLEALPGWGGGDTTHQRKPLTQAVGRARAHTRGDTTDDQKTKRGVCKLCAIQRAQSLSRVPACRDERLWRQDRIWRLKQRRERGRATEVEWKSLRV